MSAADHRAAREAFCERVSIAEAEGHERWFAENPGRTAFVRLATEAEIKAAHLRAGWPADPGEGRRYLIAVGCTARWITSKTFASHSATALTSLGDDEAGILLSALCRRRGFRRRPSEVHLAECGTVTR